MKEYDTLWGYCAADQWLAESTRLHRTTYEYLFSLRNGFTAYFVLSPENGSFASVVVRDTSRQLSASTAAPEPHDFAVRFRRGRLFAPSASTASHRAFVTIAKRPSSAVRQAELCK